VQRVLVGFACDNRCVFCAQGELRARAIALDVEAELDQVTAGHVVAFIGGEPTLHPALPAWIERARRRGAAEIVVQTNGRSLALPGRALALAQAGVTRLDISLHGSTAPMHDFHTGAPGSFDETTLGVRLARGAGLELGITTVVTRSNFRHLSDIVRLSAELGAGACHFAIAQRHGKAAGGYAVPPAALLRQHWSAAIATARDLGLACYAGATSDADPELGARWFAGIGVVDTPLPGR
jgi:MoaA/NifB/PqqE/SkfB family radical SAM enzyme